MSQLATARGSPTPALPGLLAIAGTSDLYQSLGMQVKWTPEGLHLGAEPLRWKSTAFNADYWGACRLLLRRPLRLARLRYGAGQDWNSVGAWFNPFPGDLDDYVGTVQGHATRKPWRPAGS